MRFRVTRTIQESPEGSGIFLCTVAASADPGDGDAREFASDSCTVGSRVAAEMIAKRMQAALAARILGDGHQVHFQRDEFTS